MQRDLDRKPSVRKRPNIKDIAKAAGLSTAAVSYALSGKDASRRRPRKR